MTRDHVDFEGLNAKDRYKLLEGSVVPRPIALVTTLDREGRVNAAPFSFFNAICDDPPLIAFGVSMVSDGVTKDTADNIRYTGSFVVNLVDEAMAEAMNICALELPRGENELRRAGLTEDPSHKVAPPGIAEAPISLECRRHSAIEVGLGRSVVLGEVLAINFRKGLHDPERNYVLAENAGLIGRMHGGGWYCRTADRLYMARSQAEDVLSIRPGDWLKTPQSDE